MSAFLERLIPPEARVYSGHRGPVYLLGVVAAVGTVRSLIHMLSPDGGAHSIAGLAIDVEGGPNLVALFSQWGASQLILALTQWLVLARYRGLVPFMWLLVALEQALRIGMGHLKPLVVATPPPGAYGSQILLPISVVALAWSLRRVQA